MPIYEFRCRACGRKTTTLVLVRAEADQVACRHCGGRDLERLWSRFATPKSEEARLDRLADSDAFADVDENDPASVARAMKRMAREMGEDFGDELDAALEESEREGEEPGEGTRSEDDL
jgi:putative FmdB family regulatory protein